MVFSFEAFGDSSLESSALSYLAGTELSAGKVRAAAENCATVRISFTEPSPEQLYDAIHHVRVMPGVGNRFRGRAGRRTPIWPISWAVETLSNPELAAGQLPHAGCQQGENR